MLVKRSIRFYLDLRADYVKVAFEQGVMLHKCDRWDQVLHVESVGINFTVKGRCNSMY